MEDRQEVVVNLNRFEGAHSRGDYAEHYAVTWKLGCSDVAWMCDGFKIINDA